MVQLCHIFWSFVKGKNVNTHYSLSWDRSDFLSKLKLFWLSLSNFWKEIQKPAAGITEKAAAYSALSSTYYSIAGTALAKIRNARYSFRALFAAPLWFLLGGWCYLRMLSLSDKVVELIGYDNMSADQCDVRQSILRKRGKFSEARRCIMAAWGKEMSDTSYCLLQLGMADVWIENGDKPSEIIKRVHEVLHVLERDNDVSLRQKIRILKQAGKVAAICREDELADRLVWNAQHLANEHEVRDQIAKI